MKFLCVIFISLALVSCHSFYISTESLKQQYSNVDSASLREVVVKGPYIKLKYLANPIRKLICTDKKGIEYTLEMSPSIEMEVTDINGWNIGFYADRTMIRDNKLIGARSRLNPVLGAEIPLDSIIRIRVKDGWKNFYYLKR